MRLGYSKKYKYSTTNTNTHVNTTTIIQYKQKLHDNKSTNMYNIQM